MMKVGIGYVYHIPTEQKELSEVLETYPSDMEEFDGGKFYYQVEFESNEPYSSRMDKVIIPIAYAIEDQKLLLEAYDSIEEACQFVFNSLQSS